jgi:long-chain acyl-CoA synthetase
MTLTTRFSATETLELARREKPTIFPLVPAICAALCDELERQEKRDGKKPPPLDTIRLCISGAAPLPPALIDRFESATGAPVIEGYGLTEASPVTHVNVTGKPRPNSIGLPMPDTKVRVVQVDSDPLHPRDVAPGEPGEMLISGPQVMLGYFANPEQTRAALLTTDQGETWLRTGDIARMDAEGFFYVLDRKKDMIIRAGLKVFPCKVEAVLRRHPRITDAAVVGRADAVKTETVVAVVVATDPEPPPDKSSVAAALEADRKKLADELRALCREHLAPYEVPQEFEFLKELPRSPLGKLLKRELRKKPAEAPPAEAAAPQNSGAVASVTGAPADGTSAPPNGKPSGNGHPSGNGNGHASAFRTDKHKEGV